MVVYKNSYYYPLYFQMREVRLREVKQLAQGHQLSQWSWDPNPGSLAPESTLLSFWHTRLETLTTVVLE